MKIKLLFILLITFQPLVFGANDIPERPLYLDPSQSVQTRVENLMSLMTLKEKVAQMCQYVGLEHMRDAEKNITEEELLNYLRHQGLVEQFIRFADTKGVKRRNILIQKSYKRLEANIYGNIIYNMLGLEAYLKYFNKSDATVQQGIELLEKGEAFPKAPVETEEEVTKEKKDGKKKRTAQAYGITEDPTRIFDFAEAAIS